MFKWMGNKMFTILHSKIFFILPSDPVLMDCSLMEIQSYIVVDFVLALFQRTTAKKKILNILEIKRSYSRYAKLKYYKLQYIELKNIIFSG